MKKSIVLGFSLLAYSTLGFGGGANGGGGGGLCFNEKCLTLAQAGLRINKEKTKIFELEQPVIEEMVSLIGKIPANINVKSFMTTAVSYSETFVIAEGSGRNFERFKKEYLKILKDNSFNTEKFELLAISQDRKTYLLPGFEKLDTRGKALLLIHESLIRNYNASVIDALTFDGLFLDYLNAIENGTDKDYDAWPMIELFAKLNMIHSSDVKEAYFMDLVRRQGTINAASVCEKYDTINSNEICDIGNIQALRLRSLHPLFSQMIGSSYLSFETLHIHSLKNNLSNLRYPEARPMIENLINFCEVNPSINGSFIIGNARATKGTNFLFKLNCKDRW